MAEIVATGNISIISPKLRFYNPQNKDSGNGWQIGLASLMTGIVTSGSTCRATKRQNFNLPGLILICFVTS